MLDVSHITHAVNVLFSTCDAFHTISQKKKKKKKKKKFKKKKKKKELYKKRDEGKKKKGKKIISKKENSPSHIACQSVLDVSHQSDYLITKKKKNTKS